MNVLERFGAVYGLISPVNAHRNVQIRVKGRGTIRLDGMLVKVSSKNPPVAAPFGALCRVLVVDGLVDPRSDLLAYREQNYTTGNAEQISGGILLDTIVNIDHPPLLLEFKNGLLATSGILTVVVFDAVDVDDTTLVAGYAWLSAWGGEEFPGATESQDLRGAKFR